MKAEITMRQLWYNTTILEFFFRGQAIRTMELMFELIEEDICKALDMIEDYAEEFETDLDELEEMFYSYSAEECAEALGLTLIEDESSEEEE